MKPVTCVILVVSDDAERLLRAGLWAVTAQATGDEVRVLLTAPALRTLAADHPTTPEAMRMGLGSPLTLLGEARALGARVVTCETELALSGLAEAMAAKLVDAIEPLPSFWRESLGAQRLVI